MPRHGRAARGLAAEVANFVIIFLSVVATNTIHSWMPADWPLVLVGVVLRVFLAAQLALDW